jgi:hypothetical protein
MSPYFSPILFPRLISPGLLDPFHDLSEPGGIPDRVEFAGTLEKPEIGEALIDRGGQALQGRFLVS